MPSLPKTNAVRLLDRDKIPYQLHAYQVDESDLSATHVAALLGEDIDCVYKTLVLRGDKNGVFVCMIPGGDELDLKLAAKASGNKSCAMVLMKDILGLTGYIRGGCSPIGMKKHYPTFIHEAVTAHEKIYISAGIRGMQIEIAPDVLIAFCGLQLCALL